jgi:organic hydroperoxide reductase OsmC/OhrA
MHPYPHQYTVSAAGGPIGGVSVNATGLPQLDTAPPVEFDGPGGTWSPETLLCASVADCFILTFRALAKAAKLEWTDLECRVDGRLERAENALRFTGFTTRARLTVLPGADAVAAKSLLEKAEDKCLIANSLLATRTLEAEVVPGG